VGAAVVPHRNTPPILDATEHDLDLVSLFVELFVVAALLLAVVARRDARRDTVLLQGGDQPVGVIPTVGDQMLCSWETGEQVSGTSVIARLPGGQQQTPRLPGAVAHGVELGIQAAFRAANTAGKRPFLSKLAAVLRPFRCVASIMRHSVVPCCCANSWKILLKIPAQLQRAKRLYSVLCGP